MKGLVPIEDPPRTREDLPEVRGMGGLVEEGVGVIVPRQEPYAGRSIDYPSNQENEYHLIRVARHSAAKALDKPEDSMYEQVGKPPIFGRPHYRRAFTVNFKTLSIDASSIDGRTPNAGKLEYEQGIRVARGFQLALSDGANIEVPSSAPAGSAHQVPGTSPIALDSLYVR